MRRIFALMFAGLMFFTPAVSPCQTEIDKAKLQLQEIEDLVKKRGKEQPAEPPQIQWNRYVTKNFEILSLDDAQGKYLYDNMEFMKTWTLWRWGMKDIDFSMKCKVVCVPSKDLYKKLFNKENALWRVDMDGNRIKSTTIWIITDEPHWNTAIPLQLTEVVHAEFEQSYGAKLPFWVHRGMTVLNTRLTDIRVCLAKTGNPSTKALLEMTAEAYSKLDANGKATYDAQAAAFTLMLRKQFGGGKAVLAMTDISRTNPLVGLQNVGKFATYEAADTAFQGFCRGVAANVAAIPNSYLTWYNND